MIDIKTVKDLIESGGKALFMLTGSAAGAIVAWKWGTPLLGNESPDLVVNFVYAFGVGVGGCSFHFIWVIFGKLWSLLLECCVNNKDKKKAKRAVLEQIKAEKQTTNQLKYELEAKWKHYNNKEQRDLIVLVGQGESRYDERVVTSIFQKYPEYFKLQWQQRGEFGNIDSVLKPSELLTEFIVNKRNKLVNEDLDKINESVRLTYILSLLEESNNNYPKHINMNELKEAGISTLLIQTDHYNNSELKFAYPIDKEQYEKISGRTFINKKTITPEIA